MNETCLWGCHVIHFYLIIEVGRRVQSELVDGKVLQLTATSSRERDVARWFPFTVDSVPILHSTVENIKFN